VKPFLLLGTRADDDVADNEYAAFLGFTGLDEHDLRRHRMEAAPLGTLDLDAWSGILMGGGPFNSSDPVEEKSPTQLRVEAELDRLLVDVVARDFPLLGACYGIGTVGTHVGAVVDRTFSEPIGRVPISLTAAGVDDQLFKALPTTFEAFVGHKEAVRELPGQATLLASSAACPVQAFRVGQHVYATQFHPELDVHGLCLRIEAYRYHGYFEPEEMEALQEMARQASVHDPPKLLQRFVELYARS
jgi:GMP synthase (glutamine-hydrolysing)